MADKTLKIDLDLRLDPHRPRGLDPLSVMLLVAIVLCTAGFVLVNHWMDAQVAQARADVQGWDGKVAEVKGELPRLARLRDENEQLRIQVDAVEGLAGNARRYEDLLRRLAGLVPSTIWLSSIHIEPSQHQLTMSGTSLAVAGARPLETLAALVNRMQATDSPFHDVAVANIDASQHVDGKGYSFQLSARFDTGAKEP